MGCWWSAVHCGQRRDTFIPRAPNEGRVSALKVTATLIWDSLNISCRHSHQVDLQEVDGWKCEECVPRVKLEIIIKANSGSKEPQQALSRN